MALGSKTGGRGGSAVAVLFVPACLLTSGLCDLGPFQPCTQQPVFDLEHSHRDRSDLLTPVQHGLGDDRDLHPLDVHGRGSPATANPPGPIRRGRRPVEPAPGAPGQPSSSAPATVAGRPQPPPGRMGGVAQQLQPTPGGPQQPLAPGGLPSGPMGSAMEGGAAQPSTPGSSTNHTAPLQPHELQEILGALRRDHERHTEMGRQLRAHQEAVLRRATRFGMPRTEIPTRGSTSGPGWRKRKTGPMGPSKWRPGQGWQEPGLDGQRGNRRTGEEEGESPRRNQPRPHRGVDCQSGTSGKRIEGPNRVTAGNCQKDNAGSTAQGRRSSVRQ